MATNTHPGKSPGQGPRPRVTLPVVVEAAECRPAVPSFLTLMPGADSRYAMGDDGHVYSCAIRGGGRERRRGPWHRLNEHNGCPVVREAESTRTLHRTSRSWWRATHPGRPWPRDTKGRDGRTREAKAYVDIHLRVDFDGGVWPACDEESEDARVTSDRARVTCQDCVRLMGEEEA